MFFPVTITTGLPSQYLWSPRYVVQLTHINYLAKIHCDIDSTKYGLWLQQTITRLFLTCSSPLRVINLEETTSLNLRFQGKITLCMEVDKQMRTILNAVCKDILQSYLRTHSEIFYFLFILVLVESLACGHPYFLNNPEPKTI